MAKLKITITYPIKDGSEFSFRSPLNYSDITGLSVHYLDHNKNEIIKDFTFMDSHRNNVYNLHELFAQNAIVKLILDCTEGIAYIQNADSNVYIENKFENTENLIDEKIEYIQNNKLFIDIVTGETFRALVINGELKLLSTKPSPASYFTTNGAGTITGLTSTGKAATEIVIPKEINEVTVTCIGDSAFDGCTKLTYVTLSDTITSIEYDAFSDCTGLTYVNMSEGVISIGSRAFSGCTKLSYIIIPDSVISMGNNTFRDTPWLAAKQAENPLVIAGKVVVDATSCTGNVVIPDGIVGIADEAFYKCRALTSVTIPDGVTSIGTGAFRNCTGLTSVTIPDGVTTIGEYAFCDCTRLTSVTIPDSVTRIGNNAFDGCTSLTSITIPDGVTTIEYSAFDGCTSLTSITIPDSVTTIARYAFRNCTGLTEVNIPDSVTTIGEYAFCDCTGLTSVTIPDSVISISINVFKNTPWLAAKQAENPLVIEGKVLIDGTKCTGNVVIPDGVTSIAGYAFNACSGLTSVTIPDSVINIDFQVFNGCTSLSSIYYKGTEEQWNAININPKNTLLSNVTKVFNYTA